MPDQEFIEIFQLNTAEEFLRFLQRRHPRWGEGSECEWVFRGQATSEWQLQPSAWRRDGSEVLSPIKSQLFEGLRPGEFTPASSPPYDHSLDCAVEYEAVHQFVELADQLGLPVPGAAEIPTGIEFFRGPHGPDLFTPNTAIALAQHHGVPTRMLDWTRNPFMAAFFAAEESKDRTDHMLSEIGPDGPSNPVYEDITVWALNGTWLLRESVNQVFLQEGLYGYTCPRSEHSFLHAQEGLFVYFRGGDAFFTQNGYWPTFESVIEMVWRPGAPRLLRKVLLSAQHVDPLLSLLWREGISRARLMPTYDSVSRSLNTKWALLHRSCPGSTPAKVEGP